MSHRRTQIRQAVVTLLTGLATTGSNITAGLVYPEQIENLPALNVLTPAEGRSDAFAQAGWSSSGPNRRAMTLELVIEGRAAGVAVLDQLDQIALEIEIAMAADITLGSLVARSLLVATATEITGELESPAGVIRLTYQCEYDANPADPQ